MALMDVLNGVVQATHAGQAYRQAQDQQTKSTMQDIMNRVALQGMGRSVNNGVVQDTGQAPGFQLPAAPAAPAPPSDQGDGIPDSLRPNGQIPQAPAVGQTPASAPIAVPASDYGGYNRKADAGRTIKYKDRNGREFQYELYSPQEQAQIARQRTMADATAKEEADAAAKQSAREQYGITPAPGVNARIGAGDNQKWLPPEWDKIAEQLLKNEKQPNLHFETNVNDDGDVTINGFDDRTGMLRSTSRFPASGKKAAGSTHLTTDDDGNVTASTFDHSGKLKGKLDLGPIGKSKPDGALTPGQEGVANRFKQRQDEQKKKDLAAVQQLEDNEHAFRIQSGRQLNNPNLNESDRTKLQAGLKASAFKVQAFQSRKAAILGATAPPKSITDKIPEGQTATAPDGHQWLKKDGITYLVK